ncbi:hypothetical protein BDF19DRAFT_414161 [Syncephalis fuscata]|nr:hypothetical protein BDF19DRAFT_414161 [Syncephalis fuscata]
MISKANIKVAIIASLFTLMAVVPFTASTFISLDSFKNKATPPSQEVGAFGQLGLKIISTPDDIENKRYLNVKYGKQEGTLECYVLGKMNARLHQAYDMLWKARFALRDGLADGRDFIYQPIHVFEMDKKYCVVLPKLECKKTFEQYANGLLSFRKPMMFSYYVDQIGRALGYLNRAGIVYPDISAKNICVISSFSKDEIIINHKFMDFGYFDVKEKKRLGQMADPYNTFSAPEVFTGQNYDLVKYNGWTFGILIYRLLASKALLEKLDQMPDSLKEYQKLPPLYDAKQLEKLHPDLRQLWNTMNNLLKKDPVYRSSPGRTLRST